LGSVDLTKEFEVLSFHPRERAGPGGKLSSQWVIKIVSANRSRGCTLLVDADTGLIRYEIKKGPSTTPRTPQTIRKSLMLDGSGIPPPPFERKLRVFAFDPSLGSQLDTAGINEVTLRVPWERDLTGKDLLELGPVGEYLEVVDRDPASGCYYAPIDLNHPHLLAQDGLPPSESNPQFHQQMVYAVAMRTVRNFERALGRLALWSPRRVQGKDSKGAETWTEDYVQRLRICPHALREANAYYSPVKKAVLFGYFPSPMGENDTGGRLTVFT